MKAIWNGTVIAESPDTVVVEGNHYFPPDSVRAELLTDSPTRTVCSWKGTASYSHITVGNEVNADAAWFYPEPKEAASNIAGYYAFWKGVTISE
jgi:uncharacterized protein (DUF427 family)